MAIPDYQTLMLPFLRLLADGKEHRAADAVEQLNDEFGLTPEERQQHLASGSQTVMRNRVGWVCTYLKKAALILSTGRGVFVITERGLSVLAKGPARIDVKYLEQFPEFVEFRELRRERSERTSQLSLMQRSKTLQKRLSIRHAGISVSISSSRFSSRSRRLHPPSSSGWLSSFSSVWATAAP